MFSAAVPDLQESWITFLSHRSGNNLLYRMHPDGSDLTPIFGGELRELPGLDEGQSFYRQPHWTRQSPDRRYFLSWTGDVSLTADKWSSSVRFMIYLGRTSLTDGLSIGWFTESRYSPDGTRVATVFSRRTRLVDAGFHELGVFDVASETLEPIASFPDPDRIHGPICWSPDGSEILISRPLMAGDRRENLESDDARGLGIWAIRLDGMSTRFLTTGWSPDWR
jgi:hypothetical protein